MKELTVIRHAKSDWTDAALRDHDRPLNMRGRENAPMVGKALAERELVPDLIISSTATRALTTAREIAAGIGYDLAGIREDGDVYDATVGELLDIVQALDDTIGHVFLFGHNPGTHGLVNFLLADEPIPRFVTCAVARLRLDIENWREAGPACAGLIEHLYPKILKDGD